MRSSQVEYYGDSSDSDSLRITKILFARLFKLHLTQMYKKMYLCLRKKPEPCLFEENLLGVNDTFCKVQFYERYVELKRDHAPICKYKIVREKDVIFALECSNALEYKNKVKKVKNSTSLFFKDLIQIFLCFLHEEAAERKHPIKQM